MQGTRWAVAIFVLCLGWTSVRGQQVLSVSAGGLTRSYTTSDLLGRPDVRTVSTRRDDAYRQAMEPFVRPLLVEPHQPRIAGHIGCEDRGQTAFYGLLHGLPQERRS